MKSIIGRCRDIAGRKPSRSLQPSLEGLEDRRLLSTANGGHWYNPILITYSFMPDGTIIGGGVASSLYSSFNAVTSTATWQGIFKKAAAVWQQVANFNITQVADDGTAQGSSGYQQGDSRFGDIRIGATPMSPGYLGYTILPPPLNGGTDAGDIVMNSTAAWQINNDYDLLTVAIHEFGHALGMGHSAIQAADMYASYTAMKQSLTSDDISGIDSLYGAVPADPTNNTTSATAIDLSPLIDGNSQVAYKWGYVTNYTDMEWYKVTVPSTTNGTMVVTMQSTNLSSLSPRLTLFNSNMASVGQSLAAYSYGATVSYTVTGVSPGQVFYIRASIANNGPGSNGAFGLLINFGSQYQAPIPPPNTQVAEQGDQIQNGWTPEVTGSHPGHGHAHITHRKTKAKADGDQVVVKIGNHKAVADALTVGAIHPRASARVPHRHH